MFHFHANGIILHCVTRTKRIKLLIKAASGACMKALLQWISENCIILSRFSWHLRQCLMQTMFCSDIRRTHAIGFKNQPLSRLAFSIWSCFCSMCELSEGIQRTETHAPSPDLSSAACFRPLYAQCQLTAVLKAVVVYECAGKLLTLLWGHNVFLLLLCLEIFHHLQIIT